MVQGIWLNDESMKEINNEKWYNIKNQANNDWIEFKKNLNNSDCLVRRMSYEEYNNIKNYEDNLFIDNVFPPGRDGEKVFSIGNKFYFVDKNRTINLENYPIVLRITITNELETYLLLNCIPNTMLKFINDCSRPRFKNEKGEITLVVPKSGWLDFWSNVGDYDVSDATNNQYGGGY